MFKNMMYQRQNFHRDVLTYFVNGPKCQDVLSFTYVATSVDLIWLFKISFKFCGA